MMQETASSLVSGNDNDDDDNSSSSHLLSACHVSAALLNTLHLLQVSPALQK